MGSELIIETLKDFNGSQAVMNLGALRAMHDIDDSLSEADAVLAIQTIINTPPPTPAPSPEERIAAALEYQNLLSL